MKLGRDDLKGISIFAVFLIIHGLESHGKFNTSIILNATRGDVKSLEIILLCQNAIKSYVSSFSSPLPLLLDCFSSSLDFSV